MIETQLPLHVVFVEAWIRNGDKLLLAKRSSKDDQKPGCWSPPGGKIEMGLEIGIVERSLKREVIEEVGVEIDNPVFFASQSFIRSSGDHVIKLCFLVDYISGKPEALEDQDEVKWVDFAEVDKYCTEKYFEPILTVLRDSKYKFLNGKVF